MCTWIRGLEELCNWYEPEFWKQYSGWSKTLKDIPYGKEDIDWTLKRKMERSEKANMDGLYIVHGGITIAVDEMVQTVRDSVHRRSTKTV